MNDGVKATEKTVIRKLKRPDKMGRWAAYVVNKDRYGLWLFSPKGTIYRGQSGKTIGECEVGQGTLPEGLPVIHLMPEALWWTASWCREHETRISVDICTPPVFDDEEWTYTDLELDPLVWADGRITVDDEDEFVESCEAGRISDSEATSARSTTMEVVKCMQDGAEPFGRLGWERLGEALSLSLPPIRTLRHVPAWQHYPQR